MKQISKIFILSSILVLSGCSSKYPKNNVYADSSSNNVAKLKLTTNQSHIYVIPNASCVALSDKVFNLRNKWLPTRDDLSFSFKKPPLKEFNEKSIGMINIPIETLKDKFPNSFNNATYSSTEFKFTANQPVVIFMKSEPNIIGDTIDLFKNGDGSYATFGVTFTPVEGREYQLILEKDDSSSEKLYTSTLFDITDGYAKNITLLTQRSRACK